MQQENSNESSAETDIAVLADQALQHYQEGRLQEAREICLGILHRQQRPDAILILAKIAHEKREFGEAVERYRQFLNIVPDHAQTHYYLGLVLEELGHPGRAIEHYRKSIAISDDDAAVHSRLADACGKLKRWNDATEAYQQVLSIRADDVGTMIKLGNAFVAAQSFTESIAVYERALEIRPDSARLYGHLGTSHQRMGQLRRAIECFEKALQLRPDDVSMRIDLARVLRQLGKAEEALVLLEKAIELEPDDDEAHINLASTLRQLGQANLAVKRLGEFLAINPACARAYHQISIMKPRQELIPVVERLLGEPKLPRNDAIYCHFALGNLFDSDKSFGQAFRHFQRANALQREIIDYDASENRQTVDRLIKVYSRDFFEGKRGFGSASKLPVFIVGMPRSGTTLVEQILSSHPSIHGAGEVEALHGVNRSIARQLQHASPNPECMSLIDEDMAGEFSAQYLQELTERCPTADRITDKLPGNFIRIGLIKTLFPDARIVHCQRDPLDNCISLFFHNFKLLHSSFELTELGESYLDYQRLMSYWQTLFPEEMFTVQYEELVMNQEEVTRHLIDYVGLDWDDRCIDFHNNERNVMTPSNLQVRQPIYKSSMNRWKRYEKHIQPLIAVLQQEL